MDFARINIGKQIIQPRKLLYAGSLFRRSDERQALANLDADPNYCTSREATTHHSRNL